MNSSAHVDNKGKNILSLGEGPTQGLNDTTLTEEAKYPINFTQYKNLSEEEKEKKASVSS